MQGKSPQKSETTPKGTENSKKAPVMHDYSANDNISDYIEWCPVFEPTESEFADFNKYIESCVSKIGTTGIFKVSPQRRLGFFRN